MAVYHKYKFTIDVAYTKTAANDTEIAADQASSLNWGDGYKVFKGAIRNYLRSKQNNRCAFCRCRVSIGTSYSNLEHLVGKRAYPQFEFLALNLVYSCTRCNMAKGQQNTLTAPVADRTLQTYPATGAGFNVINPYYDNYEDHVDLLDEIIIVAKNSTKGKNTIEFYGLARPELAEERANEQQIDKQAIAKKLVNRLLDTSLSAETLVQIQGVIDAMPTWVLEA